VATSGLPPLRGSALSTTSVGLYAQLVALRWRTVPRRLGALVATDPAGAVLVGLLLVCLLGYVGRRGYLWEGLALAISALALQHQILRQDRGFIRRLGLPFLPVALLDGALFASLAAALLIVGDRPSLAGLTLAAPILAIPWTGGSGAGIRRRGLRRRPMCWIPPFLFEWRAGIRRHAVGVLAPWMGAMALSAWPLVGSAGIIILAWLVSTFSFTGESELMVEAAGLDPQAFLTEKVATSVLILAILVLPVAAVLVVRNPAAWVPIAFSVWMALSIHVVGILQKYALFEPGRTRSVAGPVGLLTASAAALIPPAAVLLAFRFWTLACRRLGGRWHA
jgi:hypothetical protein